MPKLPNFDLICRLVNVCELTHKAINQGSLVRMTSIYPFDHLDFNYKLCSVIDEANVLIAEVVNEDN